MSLKNDFFIERIPSQMAQDVIVAKHYLHRKAPCNMAFGLFDKSAQLVGVVMYGVPPASPLRKGICGPEEELNVYELTRLWIDDSVGRNAESFLIGNTLKQLDREIIVSFADTAQDHVGYVYQATNWIYTGLSAKRTDWTVAGIDKHGHTWADKYTADEMRAQFGDRFTLEPRSRKHRYIFFNAPKARRKHLLSKLRYPVTSYPKGAKIEAGQKRITPDPQTDRSSIGGSIVTAEEGRSNDI